MSKRVLILIEGDSTCNGPQYVQAAQHLGLRPVTLSTNPTRHAYLEVQGTQAITVDTDDLDALVAECSRLREAYDVAGITTSLEAVYATVGKLCQHFHLPGPNPTSIGQCCDKFTQRELLARAGMPIPAYHSAENAAAVKRAAADIGLPVILKPAVGSGSSGVRLCRNADELAEHTTYLLDGGHIWPCPPRILVEEFAQGPYYCAHVMGKEVIGIGASEFCPPPHFVFIQSVFPATLTDGEHRRIADVSLGCLQALGLGWGPTNVELRWTKRGPVVVEVNPRLSAGASLVKAAHGIDLAAEHIKVVIGKQCDLSRRHSQTAVSRCLIPDRDGILQWISGHSQAAALPGVAEIELYAEPKMHIVRKGDYRDWIGYIIAVSSNLDQAKDILQSAVKLIDWSIKPFPTKGERFIPSQHHP
ncbi:MAG: ATP-grasp domain-containing protein [Mesorhizobium sp.]|uniref:ATP-grasp domain-containing protein n=1 Tax=unclassified Mesorhizobium TaxID=325217 RepID=UPI000FCB7936|nr:MULTISPECIES: acetyl-CoA carboxylase biotin carboxylase subunit family protein [unclassified Mesorhizobium]MCQ8876394.1 acetyl-CoA carboxylase biotin carboxylase subunit family protein [Mesorhizobium sp. LMG17149]MCT2581010.1 acetyl-CoA carboxylase biotin carboxylase subunit family protein [Mesorhizobium sp. P13.3]MDF3169777.1 acetyl-CoA carboxylase biotin carboxylase subunit family protein [Mesorhizobium sp. P16.1]MDF3180556.1 acetyl-CoA carboxylase biotin carboxylase subunit family protein